MEVETSSLYFKNVHHVFWNICLEQRMGPAQQRQGVRNKVVKDLPIYPLSQCLEVVADLTSGSI
ncbi:hypothetical protein A6R68_22603, partial [Neotoma lepida]